MATRDELKAARAGAKAVRALTKGHTHIENRLARLNQKEEDRRAATRAVLARATAILARQERRGHVEYQIAGLAQELEDGLARLERADLADDHVAYYRRVFHSAVQRLRAELDSPTPDIHEIALAAMQATWLAHIWPVLQSVRLQWRGPDNLRGTNTQKQRTAASIRTRVLAIRAALPRPTPAAIRDAYNERWPGQAPSLRTIRRHTHK